MTSAIDSRSQLHALLWYGVVALALLISTMLLATNWFLAGILVAGICWLVTLPYHTQLTFMIATVTFSSALIVPFAPGRPFVWEAAAFLGWSGVLISVLLRRFPPDFKSTIRRNRWVFFGAALFSLVLVFSMRYYGVGLNVLGSDKTGGRYYVQQIASAVFPLIFALQPLNGFSDERWLPRLILLQWLLSGTFIISDLAYAFGSGGLQNLLYFFEVPYDAGNFENASERFGIRRFQSFALAGVPWLLILLAKNDLKDFASRRTIWLTPLFLAVLIFGMLSGHRTVIFEVVGTLVVLAYAQRTFTARVVILGPLILLFGLILTYGMAERLPLAAQRAISFLPGIQVESQVKVDANNTLVTRSLLREAGLRMIPDYLLIGRGFRRFDDQIIPAFDPTGVAMFVEQGQFYNAPIGLMVNSGVFGTLGALAFLLGGTFCAGRIIRYTRRYGATDTLERVSTVSAAYWCVFVVFFVFIHGDSDMIMRSFSVHCGVLIACERLLNKRVVEREEAVQEAAAESKAELALEPVALPT